MPRNRLADRRATKLAATRRKFIEAKFQRGVESASKKRMQEQFLLGFGSTLDPDDPSGTIFRPISGGRGRRTLPSFLLDEQHRQAHRYYIENPFVKRIADIYADFIVGGGIKIVSTDESVQKAIDTFWFDEINNLEELQHQYALEFRLRGEIIWEKTSNVRTGYVRINPIDPLVLSRVRGHVGYPNIPSMMFFRGEAGEIPAQIINTIPKALQDPDPDLAKVWYFRANKSTGDLRGHSDFYAILEWCDALDNAAFSLLERMINLQIFIWHFRSSAVRDQKELRTLERKFTDARGQTALITDLNEELEAKAPPLNAAEFTQGFDKILQIIATGAGLPIQYLAATGANVGEAVVMDAPTIKTMTRAQREYITLLRHVIDEVLVEAMRVGKVESMLTINGKEVIPQDAYTIEVDPPSKREMGQVIAAAAQLAGALPTALDEGWLSKQENAQVFRHVMGQIIELDDELPEDDEASRAMRTVFTPAVMQRMRQQFERMGDTDGIVERGIAITGGNGTHVD